jgi:hypothetical protein
MISLHAKLTCHRIDLLRVLEGGGRAFLIRTRNKYALSNTTQFINSDPNRILAVMNIGAHYHQMEHKEDLDLLIHWLQEFNRPNDCAFSNDSARPPDANRGLHGNSTSDQGECEVPLKTYHDYQRVKTRLESVWALQYLPQSRLRSSHIRILDVFNMTILRQDGHSGGLDCLHFLHSVLSIFGSPLIHT